MASLQFYSIITILLHAVLCIAGQCETNIKNGSVTGLQFSTLDPSRKICAYLSIPYAQPPVGNLRFMPPKPLEFKGTIKAKSLPPMCPQGGAPPMGAIMSEDCLILNVFQPAEVARDPTSKKLPVMIWFHGGAFTSGSTHLYNPVRIQAKGDIILVTVQYRLGLLGFFSTGDSTVPGNNGLKDQALSIRWVKKNIQFFGGNPDQVTIFGESAGGASVMFQYISPLNKGLLNGVIAQSGTSLASWGIDRDPASSAALMSKRFNCPLDSKSRMVDCMRQLSWQRIIKEQSAQSDERSREMSYSFAGTTPVIEQNLPGAFITAHPEEIMKTGEIPDIPIMIGANKHDGSFILAGMYQAKFGPAKLDKNSEYMKQQIVPDILRYIRIQDDSSNRMVASSMELAYLSGVNRSSWEESMPGLVDMITVMAFKSAAQHTAELLTRRNRTVYLYSFEYHSHSTLWPAYIGFNPTIPVKGGIAHGDELLYIFQFPVILSSTDESFSNIICKLWLNFGTNGNPTSVSDTRYENWQPYTVMEEPYMKINMKPTLQFGYRNSWRPNGFEWE